LSTVVVVGKRLWIAIQLSISLVQGAGVPAVVVKWGQTWWAHRARIVLLTGVNVGITSGTEFVSRTFAQPIMGKDQSFGFIIRDSLGRRSINRQSLINIWMTLFASLLGGPVYFLGRRWHRFLFFVGFGTMNSAVSQCLSYWMRDGLLFIASRRILFDIAYNGTIKFFMFEFFRKSIINSKSRLTKIVGFRVKQDFLTTFFKVTMLNLFGFRG